MQKAKRIFAVCYRELLYSSIWICSILIVCVSVPVVYSLIPAIWLRLCVVAIAVAAVVLLAHFLYQFEYRRLHKRVPPKGVFRQAWVYAAASLALVLVVFGLFAGILAVVRTPVKQYEWIAVYGSYLLAVVLFPVIGILLFTPVLAQRTIGDGWGKYRGCLKSRYIVLLAGSLLAAGINYICAIFIDNIPVLTVISILLSTALWTVTCEVCLQYYLQQREAAGQTKA